MTELGRPTVPPVRVVLAEDHLAVAAQLRAVLAQEFEVVAVVHSASALLAAVERLGPDVVVTDIAMPGLSGLDAVPAVLRMSPHARVVVVTVHADAALVECAFSLGVAAYVVKGDAGDELNTAVRASLMGGAYLSAGVSGAAARQPPALEHGPDHHTERAGPVDGRDDEGHDGIR